MFIHRYIIKFNKNAAISTAYLILCRFLYNNGISQLKPWLCITS